MGFFSWWCFPPALPVFGKSVAETKETSNYPRVSRGSDLVSTRLLCCFPSAPTTLMESCGSRFNTLQHACTRDVQGVPTVDIMSERVMDCGSAFRNIHARPNRRSSHVGVHPCLGSHEEHLFQQTYSVCRVIGNVLQRSTTSCKCQIFIRRCSMIQKIVCFLFPRT